MLAYMRNQEFIEKTILACAQTVITGDSCGGINSVLDQPALVSPILWAYGEVHLCILTEQNHLAHVLDAKEIQCGFHTFFPGHAYSRLRPLTRTCFSFLPNSTNIRDQPFNTAVRGSLKF